MIARHWDTSPQRAARESHLSKARRAHILGRASDASASTRDVWRAHCRKHVAAARAINRELVAARRRISAALFLRKTAGYDQRAHKARVGARHAA